MKDRQIQRNLRERTLPPTVPSGTQLAPAPAAREPPAGSQREALQRTRARPRATLHDPSEDAPWRRIPQPQRRDRVLAGRSAAGDRREHVSVRPCTRAAAAVAANARRARSATARPAIGGLWHAVAHATSVTLGRVA